MGFLDVNVVMSFKGILSCNMGLLEFKLVYFKILYQIVAFLGFSGEKLEQKLELGYGDDCMIEFYMFSCRGIVRK